ncbi:MAG TPA: hypothetical protein VFQ86_00270 [Arachidicoccus soli]|nr:hypothetical protein [Arachidicoccus soli]
MKNHSSNTGSSKPNAAWLFIVFIFFLNVPLLLHAQQISVYSPDLHATLIFDPSQMTSNNARAYALVSHYALDAVNHNLQGTPEKPKDLPKEEKQSRKHADVNRPNDNKETNDSRLQLINECNKKAMALIDQRRKNYIRLKRAQRAEATAQRAALSGQNQNHQFSSEAFEQLKQINSTGSWGGN